MSQIQITLPEDTTKKLKILATKADRSLKKFIPLYLNQAVDLNLIDIDERTGTFITSHKLQSLTIEQLKEAGIKDLKLDEQPSADKQLLQQQKLDLEKEKIKNKRQDFLKEQSEKILGYPLPYLSDSYITDYILNKYPTNEDITAYITQLEEDGYRSDDSYEYNREISSYEESITITDKYKKIKAYCVAHGRSYDLCQLLQYPSAIQIENYDELIKSALDMPLDYNYSSEELDLLASYFTPQSDMQPFGIQTPENPTGQIHTPTNQI